MLSVLLPLLPRKKSHKRAHKNIDMKACVHLTDTVYTQYHTSAMCLHFECDHLPPGCLVGGSLSSACHLFSSLQYIVGGKGVNTCA